LRAGFVAALFLAKQAMAAALILLNFQRVTASHVSRQIDAQATA
jgi:hypothetical protein